jgi:hypothetical protein
MFPLLKLAVKKCFHACYWLFSMSKQQNYTIKFSDQDAFHFDHLLTCDDNCLEINEFTAFSTMQFLLVRFLPSFPLPA